MPCCACKLAAKTPISSPYRAGMLLFRESRLGIACRNIDIGKCAQCQLTIGDGGARKKTCLPADRIASCGESTAWQVWHWFGKRFVILSGFSTCFSVAPGCPGWSPDLRIEVSRGLRVRCPLAVGFSGPSLEGGLLLLPSFNVRRRSRSETHCTRAVSSFRNRAFSSKKFAFCSVNWATRFGTFVQFDPSIGKILLKYIIVLRCCVVLLLPQPRKKFAI